MSILTFASNASAWRGYEYYTGENVMVYKRVNDGEYKDRVQGNGRIYDVHINIDHPRKTVCNCPMQMVEERFVSILLLCKKVSKNLQGCAVFELNQPHAVCCSAWG